MNSDRVRFPMTVSDSAPMDFAFVPIAGPQRSEIVDPCKEHRTQHHPQHRGHPAPVDGDGRTDDGGGPGNRREVMAPQHVFVRGHEIRTIVQLMCRSHEILVEFENALGNES